MKIKNLFKIAISVVCFAFFLFLAGGSDEGSSPSSSPSNSYEEPAVEQEEKPDTEEVHEEQTNTDEAQEEEFVPANAEEDMTPESEEFIPQENETVE